MASDGYVHGYRYAEASRLQSQANTLAELLHHDTRFPDGHTVLEVGCGIGAQTVIIAPKNPNTDFVSIDIDESSIVLARKAADAAGIGNVSFQWADVNDLPFPPECFDHVFICFVLEHLPKPEEVIVNLLRVLKPGGSLTAIEGDHGSTLFHPSSKAAWKTIQCLIDLQQAMGGDSLIGRRLYPLLSGAGLENVVVSPRFVYADASRPEMVKGFTLDTYIAMVEGVRESAIDAGMIDRIAWERGIAGLRRSADKGGTFCYTFFKAVGIKPAK